MATCGVGGVSIIYRSSSLCFEDKDRVTSSSQICPLRSHYLVCNKNYLFYVVIGPICDIYLICVRFKTGISTIRYILDTHLFLNFIRMSFDFFSAFWCRI